MIVKLFVDITGAFSGSIQPVAAAKLVSVLPFLLCDLYGMTLVRKRFGMLTAGLFCFLLSAMPGLPGYMVEVRMYGFAMFFVTALMLHGYELILEYSGQEQPKKRNWIFFMNWKSLIRLTLSGTAHRRIRKKEMLSVKSPTNLPRRML